MKPPRTSQPTRPTEIGASPNLWKAVPGGPCGFTGSGEYSGSTDWQASASFSHAVSVATIGGSDGSSPSSAPFKSQNPATTAIKPRPAPAIDYFARRSILLTPLGDPPVGGAVPPPTPVAGTRRRSPA